MSWVEGPRPDITPPQIMGTVIAGIPIIASLLRAFGVYDLSLEQENALSDAVTWASVFGGALVGGDAILRTGRNLRKGEVEAALVSGSDVTPANTGVNESVLVSTGAVAAPSPSPQIDPQTGVNPATGLPNKTGFEQ